MLDYNIPLQIKQVKFIQKCPLNLRRLRKILSDKNLYSFVHKIYFHFLIIKSFFSMFFDVFQRCFIWANKVDENHFRFECMRTLRISLSRIDKWQNWHVPNSHLILSIQSWIFKLVHLTLTANLEGLKALLYPFDRKRLVLKIVYEKSINELVNALLAWKTMFDF